MTELRRASQRKFHVIYKTTCTVTGKWYIGMHSTDNIDDGYLGSGMRLWRSVNKHGKQNHTTEILEHFQDRASLALREKELVEEAKKDPMCINIGPGGQGAFDRPRTSEEVRAKLSAISRGKPKTPEHCENIRKARIGMKVKQKSHNGKMWKIIHPDGSEMIVNSLRNWASQNGMSYSYRKLKASRPVDGFRAIPLYDKYSRLLRASS